MGEWVGWGATAGGGGEGGRGPEGKAETSGRGHLSAETSAEGLGRLGGKGANNRETGRTG